MRSQGQSHRWSMFRAIGVSALIMLPWFEGKCSEAVHLAALGVNADAFAFQLENSTAPDYLIERTTHFEQWQPRLSVFSRLSSFRVLDRFTRLDRSSTGFYRAAGRAQSAAAMKAAWSQLGLKKYQF